MYVTNGATTQRLISYTEDLDGKTKIHTVDDDRDRDLDVYYSVGKTIYRKENHAKSRRQYTIKDAPRVYSTADIYSDFFGIKNGSLSQIPSDSQIDILQNNSPEKVRFQLLMKRANDHTQLRLFRSLFQTEAKDARYQVDILPENRNTSAGISIQNVPRVNGIDGPVFIEHQKIYRTLIADQKFIDDMGVQRVLSPDFVIRGGQSGYTSESTVLDVTSRGVTKEHKMTAAQRIVFSEDSSVKIKK